MDLSCHMARLPSYEPRNPIQRKCGGVEGLRCLLNSCPSEKKKKKSGDKADKASQVSFCV